MSAEPVLPILTSRPAPCRQSTTTLHARALAEMVHPTRRTRSREIRKGDTRALAPSPARRPRMLGAGVPTAERLDKGDVLRVGGMHRTQAPLDRLRQMGRLDPDPLRNDAIFQAGATLHSLYEATQQTIATARIDGRHRGYQPSALLVQERLTGACRKYREACEAIGRGDDPTLDASLLVVAVVCRGIGVEAATREQISRGRKQTVVGAGMEALRSGLGRLAKHWGYH